MTPACPYCVTAFSPCSDRPVAVHYGSFYRHSDSNLVKRFRCRGCKKTFSRATFHPCYRQNKRHKNEPLRRLLCSGVSLRRSAIILNLSRTTVARKLLFLAMRSREISNKEQKKHLPASVVEFDDMETFEHSKCKPISITVAVEEKTRRILSFEVSRMPAKGKLAAIALKKYGPRPDTRAVGRQRLFKRLLLLIHDNSEFKSDQNPHYPASIRAYFPNSRHKAFKGRRGCVVGQGELKRGGFDPLFSLNHTCAKFRADINRLFRRTWCTTKKMECLRAHLAIYVCFHNRNLEKNLRPR